jgi:hypothetical protein
MGISSYTCAKTNLPIIVNGDAEFHGKNLKAAVFFPGAGEEPIQGSLGQYQTFHSRKGTFELLDSGIACKIEKGEAKFALRDFLEPGDSFKTLGRSHSDPGQGGLTYEDEFLERAVAAGGFKSFLGLELAHGEDTPLEVALGIDEKAAAIQEAFIDQVTAGWEIGTLKLIPGNPECGIPGTIGRFYRASVIPMNSECTTIRYHQYGDPRPKPVLFKFADGRFSPDPKDFARALASQRSLGKERTAIFEADDGRAYTVKVYDGSDLYTVEGPDYPLKAFSQIDHALNTIGYDLAYPASLGYVDAEAGEFFSPWTKEADRLDAATFTIPSAGALLRP